MSANCRLCGSATRLVARQRVLGKHDVAYVICEGCELIQTEQPYWLDEAYSQAISQLDTGAMLRNHYAVRLTAVLARLLDIRGPALDYGGGHGVFVRMMRDLGFDFRWFDKYGENLYARGFEAGPDQHYSLVTAFEVLEHFADVRRDLDQLFGARPDYVLVGTILHTGHKPRWWYYALETGQHVAFYARRTLDRIAQQFGYEVVSAAEYSLFARRDRAPGALRRPLIRALLERPALAGYVPSRVVQRPSLVVSDHDEIRARMKTSD